MTIPLPPELVGQILTELVPRDLRAITASCRHIRAVALRAPWLWDHLDLCMLGLDPTRAEAAWKEDLLLIHSLVDRTRHPTISLSLAMRLPGDIDSHRAEDVTAALELAASRVMHLTLVITGELMLALRQLRVWSILPVAMVVETPPRLYPTKVYFPYFFSRLVTLKLPHDLPLAFILHIPTLEDLTASFLDHYAIDILADAFPSLAKLTADLTRWLKPHHLISQPLPRLNSLRLVVPVALLRYATPLVASVHHAHISIVVLAETYDDTRPLVDLLSLLAHYYSMQIELALSSEDELVVEGRNSGSSATPLLLIRVTAARKYRLPDIDFEQWLEDCVDDIEHLFSP